DEKNLDYLLDEYATAGLGGLEITPIYGVQGNDANDIEFLSPRWMSMLDFLNKKGDKVGLKIEMNTGTGWPFGGPEVTVEDAACKAVFDTSGNLLVGKTKQKVKRAAPGGEGFVLDHFSKPAVERYLERFTKAFNASSTRYPHNFFNDSYEVYGANWTPTLFDEFKKRRGYDLAKHKDLLRKVFDSKNEAAKALNINENSDESRRIISDYRQTLGELLLENFTQTWTSWAHSHGTITRNQAHGSPGNLIDIYAAVDIPECEGFGLSQFGIRNLRQDSLIRKNYSDLSMLKYASSAAHISGKKLTSSESFTWLTEHFRTSLSQCKPEIDLFMTAGV
ncbi:MAG: glycosyl hydrolase family 2, partial [Bacteroidaceae bacterium]|nr:glycosyl hydrolase family 2 [Bacteroidaceae bacterium]